MAPKTIKLQNLQKNTYNTVVEYSTIYCVESQVYKIEGSVLYQL